MTDAAPRRVAVTHPRTRAARRSRGAVGPDGVGGSSGSTPTADARADLDDVLLRSLISAQLRLSLLAGSLALGVLLGVPLLLLAVPELQDVTVARVPAGWLVLAVGVFPAVIVSGWAYVRAAERYEPRYRALVDGR